MTTRVTIECPVPNHEELLVQVVQESGDAAVKVTYVMSEQRVRQGESATFYVHGGAKLVVSEVKLA